MEVKHGRRRRQYFFFFVSFIFLNVCDDDDFVISFFLFQKHSMMYWRDERKRRGMCRVFVFCNLLGFGSELRFTTRPKIDDVALHTYAKVKGYRV